MIATSLTVHGVRVDRGSLAFGARCGVRHTRMHVILTLASG
jgi:hypothetical protein